MGRCKQKQRGLRGLLCRWPSITVKPYVCSRCPKRSYTVQELKSHQLTHSDYKQFCCGLCGKHFKRKNYVVQHFKKCSVKQCRPRTRLRGYEERCKLPSESSPVCNRLKVSMYITAQGCRLRNDLYCVEWDGKL